MIRHPRRTGPATVVALVVLAACVVVAVAVVQSLLGRTPFVELSPVLAATSAQRWDGGAVRAVAVVVALVGLVLLLAAVRPGRPVVLPLVRVTDRDGAPGAGAGVRRRTLARDLTAAAGRVPGGSGARVTVGRGTVTARVADTAAAPEAVRAALVRRLEQIGPARTPAVRVRRG